MKQFDANKIPKILQDHPRWVLWNYDGRGKKTPRRPDRPEKNVDALKADNWSPFLKTADAAEAGQHGVGFVLGPVDRGPSFAGIDLDDCRNPDTGAIEPWAQKIISTFASYTEVSPSGRGVKIFVLARLADDAPQGKVYKVEIYDRDRYFTVTGAHLPDTPLTVEDRDDQLKQFHAGIWSRDLRKLIRVFGFHITDDGDYIHIHCPWAHEHTSPDTNGDCGLHQTGDVIDGFKCFHGHCSERTLADVLALFGLKGHGKTHDFIVDHDGKIIARSQENIRRAIALQGATLEHDVFAGKLYLTNGTERRVLDDPAVNRLYLVIEETYRFSPPKDYFTMVIEDHAHSNAVHPVRVYLDGLQWDGVARLDRWLVTYGGASDTEFVRSASAKTLIAAVRRARKPGTKHDEMLVLEGQQGNLKSSALGALCPQESWFSDDLPLNVDAKQIIERTSGKWLIEASDLAGMRKSDIEQLKATLSRTVDGPVRMAYGHFPQERPRSFIIIGTTNSNKYLKDATGNRRFWPVRVKTFDLDGLRRDRDQIWAEAAHREAHGESNRLEPKYYAAAGKEQAARQLDDPWMDTLSEFLAVHPDPDAPSFIRQAPRDRVLLSEVWSHLGVPISHQDDRAVHRLEMVMQAMGYTKKQARGIGGPTETDDKRNAKRWCRVEASND